MGEHPAQWCTLTARFAGLPGSCSAPWQPPAYAWFGMGRDRVTFMFDDDRHDPGRHTVGVWHQVGRPRSQLGFLLASGDAQPRQLLSRTIRNLMSLRLNLIEASLSLTPAEGVSPVDSMPPTSPGRFVFGPHYSPRLGSSDDIRLLTWRLECGVWRSSLRSSHSRPAPRTSCLRSACCPITVTAWTVVARIRSRLLQAAGGELGVSARLVGIARGIPNRQCGNRRQWRGRGRCRKLPFGAHQFWRRRSV